MKLWKLKYIIEDKIKDIKDYLTDDWAILAYRVVAISILIGVVIFVLNMKYS